MIKINNLNKYYNRGRRNEIHVINNVNLELPDTGFYTILGASGSGKTTLLSAIGGLDSFKGTIDYDDNHFNGYQMSKIDDFRIKNIGYVFQNYNLLDNLTVFENLKIVLDVLNITDPDEVKKRTDYVLKTVGLYRFRKKLCKELSGGQRQRVSIARALIKRSKILIADEPTGNLDSNNSVEIMNILKKISEKSLVILVTHNKKLANFYSDVILDIEDGKIVNVRENHNSGDLSEYESNKIYLSDLKHNTASGDFNAEIYSNEDVSKLDLKLVYNNGTYYLKSNVKIELLDNSNIQILDKKEESEATEFKNDYDDSFFEDKKDNKFQILNVFKIILASIASFFKSSKKAFFVKLSLFFIGVLLGVCVVLLCTRLTFDNSMVFRSNDIKVISSTNNVQYENRVVYEAYDSGLIDNLYGICYDIPDRVNTLTVSYNKNSYETVSDKLEFNYAYGFDLLKDRTVLAGKIDETTEVVIDRAMADQILRRLELKNYKTLLNANYNFKLYDAIRNITHSNIAVVEGNENIVCLTLKNYSKVFKPSKATDTITKEGYIVNNLTAYAANAFEFDLTEGRMPQRENEIVVTDDYKFNGNLNIGDEISLGNDTMAFTFKIVGVGKSLMRGIFVHNTIVQKSVVMGRLYNYRIAFTSSKMGELNNYFAAHNYNVGSIESIYNDYMLNASLYESLIYFGVALALLIVTFIYIYFSMRTKMINDIRYIGSLRSIGVKRHKIFFKYLLEIIIYLLFTSVIGYVLVVFVGGELLKFYYQLYYKDINIFKTMYPFLGLGLLAALNILFGMLPIGTLLLKSPSKIMSKYDM